MLKVLVFGAGGLLGRELSRFEHDDFEIKSLDHAQCDITDTGGIERIISVEQPDIIINCAVIVSVDKRENDPQLCFGVNRDGVKNLLDAVAQAKRPVIFVQISSSEVFGRVKEGEYKIEGYAEDDEPRPVTAYQKSKAEAELVLREFTAAHPDALKRCYIARAGWLYGAGRKTFVEQFLEKLQNGDMLEVIVNQWRSPTWTHHFAKGLLGLLSSERESGIYHITNEVERGEASTLDVVEELALFLGTKRVRASLKLVSREDIFKIPRAPSNVILNTKLPKLPHWRSALRDYLNS